MTLTEKKIGDRLYPRPVRFFKQIGSTNDVTSEWLKHGGESGSIVVADEQVSGRGRLGRVWHTPAGTALIVSVILRPRSEDLSQITMLGALAISDTIRNWGIQHVGIKWPNDVQINGLKVSGILPEVVWENEQLVGVVLGMGINVRIDFTGTELMNSAVSIEPVLGRPIDRLDLLEDVLKRIDYWFARLGQDELFDAWKKQLVTIGQHVRLQSAGYEVAGLAQAVDKDGALLIRRADGLVERVIAGDIALG
ncbi:MAG: biotin--[acetyl-CoA-carboxylase] ligase [Anaerolineaceae bacterium]|nr:biotin--[acetyl-CoA-carboxylase] ligase [Anaerolineaceae bacterium]